MLSRSMRFLLVPVSACLIFTAASTFAGGSPPDVDRTAPRTFKRDTDKDGDRPKAELVMEGLHKRMMALHFMRREAVRNGDVEAVRKIDDAVNGMIKTLDGAFPDLMRMVKEHENDDNGPDGAIKINPDDKRQGDTRRDGMNRRTGDTRPTQEEMRKRMADKMRDRIERHGGDQTSGDTSNN